MLRNFRLAVFFSLFAVAFANLGQPTTAQAEKPAEKPAETSPSTKLHGRLPAYYRLVVTEEQRQQIYRIQGEYQDRIAALESECRAIKKQRDAEIAAVLSEEQQEEVEKARSAAKADRAKKSKKQQRVAGDDSAGLPEGDLPDR